MYWTSLTVVLFDGFYLRNFENRNESKEGLGMPCPPKRHVSLDIIGEELRASLKPPPSTALLY